MVNSPHHGEFVDTRNTECSATHCTCKKSFDETGECQEIVEINNKRFDETFNFLEIIEQSWDNSSVVEEIMIDIETSNNIIHSKK